LARLLIISYTFPPVPGIGGRRWAKFAKYLALKGHEVFVVCAKSKYEQTSEWMPDIISPSIHVFQRWTRFPFVLTHQPNSLYQKLLYHLWTYVLTIYSKGRIYDRSIFWRRDVVSFSEELIRKYQICNVICTIPPFRLAYYSSILKKRNPNINLILDYRDPWTNNQSFHEFNNLSERRRRFELKMEQTAINCADHVVSTTAQMTLWAKEKALFPEKCITISNGFDKDDVITAEPEKKSEINFLFAGNLYSGLEYVFIPFLTYLKEQERKDKSFDTRFKFHFYGNIDSKLKREIDKYGLRSINVSRFIPITEVRKKYASADYFLMFSVEDHAFAFNTKFFEYLSYRKPILHFSNRGEVSNFLESHQIGFGIEPDNFNKKLDMIFKLVQEDKIKFNLKFKVDKYSIDSLVDAVEKLLVTNP
jgi:glycosyltransferase involved in cell wall biosynthesis